jgi:hypothetical protein
MLYPVIYDILLDLEGGRAIAEPVSRRLPSRRPGFKPGYGHVGFCDGQKWR